MKFSKEKNRASAIAINAEIRRTKVRLLEEVPKLQRLAAKKESMNLSESNSSKRNISSSLDEEAEMCRLFSLGEIRLATNNFDDGFIIGKGGFGYVYIGLIDGATKIVAIKRLTSSQSGGQGAGEFRAEINALSKLQHNHLVSLIGFCDEGEEMILVYKYMVHGTLADHFHKNGRKDNGKSPLPWEQRLNICISAARGLEFLHTGCGGQHGIIHRDVKSSNILLDENWVVKISDFGLSKMDTTSLSHTHITTEVKGTPGYLDPEYYNTQRLTKKSDVYAFGVVLLELLCGRRAMDVMLEQEEHNLALWAQNCFREGKLDQIVDPSLKEQISHHCLKGFAKIANQCLHAQSKKRLTMAEIVVRLDKLITSELGRKKKDWWLWDLFCHGKMPSETVACEQPRVDCPSFSLAVIRAATKDFSNRYLIGYGGDSRVYKGYLGTIWGKVTIRIRRFSRNYLLNDSVYKELANSLLQCINIVSLVGYCPNGHEMILVHEYMANGTLFDCLHNTVNNQRLSWKQRLQICIGAARGLNYLHTGMEQTIIHGNVKSSKILLDQNWFAKISGFELSLLVPGHQSVKSPVLTEQSDVYSFGMVLIEVLSGKKPCKSSKTLSDWVLDCLNAWSINLFTDPYLIGKICRPSFCVFVEIAMKCMLMSETERPPMTDVVRRLELALELQETYVDHAGVDNEVIKVVEPPNNKKEDNILKGKADCHPQEDIINVGVRACNELQVDDKTETDDPHPALPPASAKIKCFWPANVFKACMWQFYGFSGPYVPPLTPEEMCRCFSLAEIRAATDNFKDEHLISKGTCSRVYMGYMDDGTKVAIKRWMSIKDFRSMSINFQIAIKWYSQLRHINLVSLLGYCRDGVDEMILVYEYMDNKTLFDHLQNTINDPLSWKQRLQICIGAARGLNHLHTECQIIHGNIRSSNILPDQNWVTKLSYFGFSSLLTSSELTEKSDVLAFGVVLFEVLCGRRVEEKQRYACKWSPGYIDLDEVYEIIDPCLIEEVWPDSLSEFVRIAVKCLHFCDFQGPPMTDVLHSLETVMGLQESGDAAME